MSSKINALLVCNAYPSDKNLYRNGFIHRRVKAYSANGINVEVFYHHEPATESHQYVFDGINVTVGDRKKLESVVQEFRADVFLVHFAEENRVQPILEYGGDKPVIVWIHGFEAEAWHRRWFNFIDSFEAISEALEKKNTYYRHQNGFLSNLILEQQRNVTFVNVSEWFQRFVVEPDLGVEFDETVVIPNLVDEAIFRYVPKRPADRLKILSIRPYASAKYANDLMVDAIRLLSERPYFDELEFSICGDGRLFDKTVDPVRKFKNVKLSKGFLTQENIAKLHREHGVFVSPTRFDSQGVSMCEAASSGLVVVSTSIAAVPEFFTDGVSAQLATPESAESIADKIEELYFDPSLYLDVSRAGSERIQEQCGSKATVEKEIELIRDRVGGADD